MILLFHWKADRTKIILPLESDGKASEKASEKALDLKLRHQQILDAMEEGKEYSVNELAELVGLKGTRTRELLRELAEMGKIETVGSTKGKRYIKK